MLRIAILFLLFTSCQPKQEESSLIPSLGNSLEQSSNLISISTDLALDLLLRHSLEPEHQVRAKHWEPRARKVRETIKPILLLIDSMQQQVKEKPAHAEGELKSRGQILFEKLKKYKLDVLRIDSQFVHVYEQGGLIKALDKLSQADFENVYLKGSSTRISAALKKLKNQLAILEYKLVHFCYDQLGGTDRGGLYSTYSAIIGQNATVISPGKEVEIVAGIGAFSRAARPAITIGGKLFEVNEEGHVRYFFKAPEKPGDYKTEVMIEFTDENGERRDIRKTIEYTVAALASPKP